MTTESNNCLDAEVEKLLKHVAEKEGLLEYKINKTENSTKGEGYLGVITAVEITESNGSHKKVLNLIVKAATKSDALRGAAPIADVYQREVYMYSTLIPAFQKFQNELGVKPTSSFAKCYKATTIDKNEALVLENLRSKGFRLWERRTPMNEEHVAFVMNEYGRFHALSFALKDQNPKKFGKLTQPLSDVFCQFMENQDFAKMLVNQCYKAAEALNTEEDAEALNAFKKFVGKSEKLLKNLPQLVDDYSVVLHGDCWTSNIMFAYDNIKKPNTPTRIRLIDLQLSRLGPPIIDLSNFFYACGSKDVITNFKQYWDIYYNSLASYLKELGSNPEKVYPYSVFCRQWRESAKFGLLVSMFLIKMMLSEQDEIADYAEAAESSQGVVGAFGYDLSRSDEYNERVKHIILHFVNNGFI